MAPPASPTSSAEQCVAFCRVCDKCYQSATVSNASCHFLMNGSEQAARECEADCQAGVVPSAVARGGFGANWKQLTCEQLNDSL